MIKFREVDQTILNPLIAKIFSEQDDQHFSQSLDENKQEYVIAAYENNILVGGVIGKKEYQNIHISILVVKKEVRKLSLGSQLLKEIEKIARTQDIINVTLTTRSYQAVDFYKKNGYNIFAALEDMPMKGVTKYYFCKRMQPSD